MEGAAAHVSGNSVDLREGLRRFLAPLWTEARRLDDWDLDGVADEQIHLMVPTMEAWLVADPEALARFYGQGFAINPTSVAAPCRRCQ